jgi:hypothetical protein
MDIFNIGTLLFVILLAYYCWGGIRKTFTGELNKHGSVVIGIFFGLFYSPKINSILFANKNSDFILFLILVATSGLIIFLIKFGTTFLLKKYLPKGNLWGVIYKIFGVIIGIADAIFSIKLIELMIHEPWIKIFLSLKIPLMNQK